MSSRVTRSARAKQRRDSVKKEPTQLSSPPATPLSIKQETEDDPNSKRLRRLPYIDTTQETHNPANISKKRAHKDVKDEDESDTGDLPHNLGRPSSQNQAKKAKPKKTQITDKIGRKARGIDLKEAQAMVEKVTKQAPPHKPSRSKKRNVNYGLTPGSTPYPDWPHPTPEECHDVVRLLSKVHGEVKAPEKIPAPSLSTSGCGEVPSVLDALVRTRLSAATSGTNSSRAFRGLIDRFGILEDGVGKGSVNWDAVREADVKDVFAAIQCGGLADVKSKDIKKILDMVHEENEEQRRADKDSDSPKRLSLDHLHKMSNDEAFNHLVRYPGIGPKTASCVLLFCLQRPSFAVDTHVFRLCTWLGWVPPGATRNSTYAHCEVRIPGELKYPLHYLMIRHGKTCPRCRAATSSGSEGWRKGCPIEKLVKRTGVRKGGAEDDDSKTPLIKKRSARRKKAPSETSEEESFQSESESESESGAESNETDQEDWK